MTKMSHYLHEPDYSPEDLLLLLNVKQIKRSLQFSPNAFYNLALVTYATKKEYKHLKYLKTNCNVYVVIRPLEKAFFSSHQYSHKFTYIDGTSYAHSGFNRMVIMNFPLNTHIIERTIIAWDQLTTSSNSASKNVLPYRKSQPELKQTLAP